MTTIYRTNTPKTPAIVCGNHIMGLGIIRSLGQHKVPVTAVTYETSDMAYLSKYVNNCLIAPSPLHNERKFIAYLSTLPARYKGGVLFASDDATLSAVARNKRTLNKQYRLACADWNIARKFIDKKYTYELAHSLGIPAPKSKTARSIEHIESFIDDFTFPCLVKPCQSHLFVDKFKTKMNLVHARDALFAEFRKAQESSLEVMIQEYIPGTDTGGVNYNSFIWQQKCIAEFTAEKVRLSPPGFGVPCVVRHKPIDEIKGPGRKILKALRFNGYSCTEFKKDPRDGVYKLMEVNGRHNRSGLLALACGINFPLMEYEFYTQNRSSANTTVLHDGLYWVDEFKDMATWLKSVCLMKYPLGEFIRPYINRNVFAVFDRQDIKPFVKRTGDCFSILKSGKN
ncbi:MAG: hypothetical protein GF401_19260 [Chitinivibrionales bacterium]|nr:hypothetical protein [Chitinivibrionales bacterium]